MTSRSDESEIRLVIGGRNRISVPVVRQVVESGLLNPSAIAVIPTAGDPALKTECASLGISVYRDDQINDLGGLFLSLEYDKIIDPSATKFSALFNVHFSKLPAYKGCWNSIYPILNGETSTGVTLHEVDAGIDTGPIVAARDIILAPEETAHTLYEKYNLEGAELAIAMLPQLLRGDYTSTPQPLEGSTYFKRSSLNLKNTEIDPFSTFTQIDRKVRAFFFPQYQTATYRGAPIASARSVDRSVLARPGTLFDEAKSTRVIQAIDAVVELRLLDEEPRP